MRCAESETGGQHAEAGKSPAGVPLVLTTEAMATRFELLLYGEDAARLRSAGEEAIEEIGRLDAQLSAFRPESEISGINARAAKEAVRVEPRLFRLLALSRDIHRMTDGAFDITIAPLLRCWGFMGGDGAVPDDADIEAARALVGMDKVELDEEHLTIRFERSGMMLDLGAVGKGYAVERAAGLLREAGIRCALIHGGTSSVCAIGPQPDGSAWQVAVKGPTGPGERLAAVGLQDSSVSVSSTRGKWFRAGRRTFGHVIDPRTGRPISRAASAVVTGSSPTVCDALSTALLVLGEPWAPTLAERWPGCSGRAFGS